jgi:hypothetical protein
MMGYLRVYKNMRYKKKADPTKEEANRDVYKAVRIRSGGRCEVNLLPTEGPRENLEPMDSFRCKLAAKDRHHVIKPRSSNTTVDSVVDLCRQHHDRCEWPYAKGRLVITPLGNQRFRYTVKYASDKWAMRAIER